ncbi:MAG: transcription elongation factor GreA, partial [Planctomycetota bacterium]
MEKVYMSKDGFEKSKKELEEMKMVKRAEIQEAIATA